MYGLGAIYGTGYLQPAGGGSGSGKSSTDGHAPPLDASDMESIIHDEQSATLLFAVSRQADGQSSSSSFLLGMLGTILDMLDTHRQASGLTGGWKSQGNWQSGGSNDGSSGGIDSGGTGLSSSGGSGGDKPPSNPVYG